MHPSKASQFHCSIVRYPPDVQGKLTDEHYDFFGKLLVIDKIYISHMDIDFRTWLLINNLSYVKFCTCIAKCCLIVDNCGNF